MEVIPLPTPVKTLDNMSKHLTRAELEARSAQEGVTLPSRKPKKPRLIAQDKAAAKHWERILKDMDGLEILDVLDTDALAVYCAKLARRDDLQVRYLQAREAFDSAEGDSSPKLIFSLSAELGAIERDLLSYASKLGLTPESRARLAKRLAEQDEDGDPDDDLFA